METLDSITVVFSFVLGRIATCVGGRILGRTGTGAFSTDLARLIVVMLLTSACTALDVGRSRDLALLAIAVQASPSARYGGSWLAG